MRFFLDNCLSPRYAKSLDILSERDGHSVVHLVDKFERSVDDPTWIRALESESDWVIVSGDTRILRSPQLKAEWRRSGLTAFFLSNGWMKVSYWHQASLLVTWWPSIIESARLMQVGTGFEIPFRRPGRFKVVR